MRGCYTFPSPQVLVCCPSKAMFHSGIWLNPRLTWCSFDSRAKETTVAVATYGLFNAFVVRTQPAQRYV